MAQIHTFDLWNGAEFDWRRVQAASDLKALALPHAPVLIAAMIAQGGPAALVADRMKGFLDSPDQPLDPDEGPFVRVWLHEVISASTPVNLPALAALLAAVLLDLRNPGDLATLWERAEPALETLPPPICAAFFNGFRELLVHTDLYLDPPLDTDLCLSHPADSICAPLQAIAAQATESELAAISRADYGNDADRHLRRLTEVIETQACAIAQNDTWYPLEVVQLRSHVPEKEGWLVATAVVLVTAIRLRDFWSDAEFRWSAQANAYRALGPEPRAAILDAMRHLYQASENFGLTSYFNTVDSGPTDSGPTRLLPPEAAAVLPDHPGL